MNLGHLTRPRVLGKKDLHVVKVFQRPAKSRLVKERRYQYNKHTTFPNSTETGDESCFRGRPLGLFAARAASSPNDALSLCLYPVPGGRPSLGRGPYVTGLIFALPFGRPRLRSGRGGVVVDIGRCVVGVYKAVDELADETASSGGPRWAV